MILIFTSIALSQIKVVYMLDEQADGFAFDGTNDKIEVSDNSVLDFGTADFSLEVYVKILSYNGTTNDAVLNKGRGIGYSIYLDNSNFGIRAYIREGANLKNIFEAIPLNKKTHIIVVSDRSANMTLFVDGVDVGSVDITSIGDISSSSMLVLGGGDVLAGTIGYGDLEIYYARIYNKALITSEVSQLWNNGNPNKATIPSGIVVNYEGKNASTLIWKDSGSNGLNGDVSGAKVIYKAE